MIECENVCLTYRKKAILQGASLTARPGQITALLGKNGSGKSSLARCIAGARHHCTGTILLNGQPSQGLSPNARARLLAVMPQTLPQPPITVEELVSMGRQPYLGYGGSLPQSEREKVRLAMRRTGLERMAQSRVCSLSGGERQLAFFTLLLAQAAPIALLDEPTANLDAEYRQMVYAHLRAMRAEGRTVVVVMHDLADAVELADCICVMDKGRVIFSGTPQAFAAAPLVGQVFGLRPVQVPAEAGGPFTVFRCVKAQPPV